MVIVLVVEMTLQSLQVMVSSVLFCPSQCLDFSQSAFKRDKVFVPIPSKYLSKEPYYHNSPEFFKENQPFDRGYNFKCYQRRINYNTGTDTISVDRMNEVENALSYVKANTNEANITDYVKDVSFYLNNPELEFLYFGESDQFWYKYLILVKNPDYFEGFFSKDFYIFDAETSSFDFDFVESPHPSVAFTCTAYTTFRPFFCYLEKIETKTNSYYEIKKYFRVSGFNHSFHKNVYIHRYASCCQYDNYVQKSGFKYGNFKDYKGVLNFGRFSPPYYNLWEVN